MSSSSLQPDFERRLSYPNTFSSRLRPAIELPPPLEPRPIYQLHSSLSEASGTQLRQETFQGNAAHPTDCRQNLPGLRDILTPGPSTSSQPSHYTSWSQSTSTSTSQQPIEAYYRQTGAHPPLALYPPSDPSPPYHNNPVRRLELPILETSPVVRQPPHSVPPSPFPGYLESRDYAVAHSEPSRQASSTSYLTNGMPSPYARHGPDESQYRNATTCATGPPNAALSPSGTESQKKYMGVHDIPGEGTFHFYEGGYRIPTHVDGEMVNPAWGLTKANKPRKRLALACLDCREKKIKCEPGANSCLQCEKAKRLCRRAPTQPPHADPSTTSTWSECTASPVRKSVSDPTPGESREADVDPMNKRRTREDSSPPNAPTKKHRSASPTVSTLHAGAPTRGAVTVEIPTPTSSSPKPSRGLLVWEEDPYGIDSDTTLHLLDLYFAHVNNASYCMFPRDLFLHWVKSCPNKFQNERMVLYAMLALGSAFTDGSLSGFGKSCAEVASDAIAAKTGRFNICVVQTHLLLALYYFAKGKYGAAWDHHGLAIRASTNTCLRMNTEDGCLDDAESLSHARIEYNFTREQLAECKRRTFWSCFLMDRYARGTHCAICIQDVFLRLPCADDVYERSHGSEAPYFNNGIIDPAITNLVPSSKISPMAWLTLSAANWGEVLNFSHRAVYRADTSYRAAYERFYADIHTAFQEWSCRLPNHLRYSQANLDRSIEEGYADTFIAMHALYHFSLMKLNRYVRHSMMMDLVPRNIRAAHHHAHALLSMMKDLQAARRDTIDPASGQVTQYAFSTPYSGYTALSAIDVVGAGGLDSSLGSTLEVIRGGLGCLRELSIYWNSSREQLRDSESRFYQIQNILTRPNKSRGGAWLGRHWGMAMSLDKEFGLADDCIYGITDDGSYSKCYFDAWKEDAHHGNASSGGLRVV